MVYEVVECFDHPGDWLVEAINRDGDGEIYGTIFTGPEARQRAAEYAAWKNGANRSHAPSVPPQRQRA